MEALLTTKNLSKKFSLKRSVLGFKSDFFWAVNNVNFTIEHKQNVGLVGESGSGKSTVARLIMQLLKADKGVVTWQGKEISNLTTKQRREVYQQMQMIFQDPLDAFDIRWKISDSLAEPLRIIEKLSHKQIQERMEEVLSLVNFPLDRKFAYPYQLSGGQRQRALIARSLILKPKLIIADEPVSALDVSMQAQILNEMKELANKLDITYLFISHDLHVVRFLCSFVIVMYQGHVLETGASEEIYTNPLHPYTQELHNSILIPAYTKPQKKVVTKEVAFDRHKNKQGCPFAHRCPEAFALCNKETPVLQHYKDKNRQLACHIYQK